ncbi:hypothetical protein Pmar_PMAR017269 [Perkinsus marinus ATCC 50983]|uniref:Uncharacterized protein n=1 Tax=Perkinsus marinus (strain ATCC 50983 / TXsc) TaxID=423536 RepID=C5LH47_PERM5|nr:hypothetical protein Pmar_PMAR017269 [Perkinsus marinus ATCC 50983]EER03856.1 hypothetical protein Pmar_PMAR017269 [Perkinsus marinus ATCC 50983]|eukprot:XP_002772040.1 hypothetical protein Pmar_PMAR017269 [Perkinsus marinus ATCC 50983]
MVPRPSTINDLDDENLYDFVAALGTEEEEHLVDENTQAESNVVNETGHGTTDEHEEEETGKNSSSNTGQEQAVLNSLAKTIPLKSIVNNHIGYKWHFENILYNAFSLQLDMLGNRVPPGKKFALLRLNLQGGAYTTIEANVCPSSHVTVAEDDKLYRKARMVLIDRYGMDLFKSWHQFINRKLRPNESPAEFLTELQRLVSLSRPSGIKLDQTWMNSAACLMFWEGLPSDIPGLPALKSQWKTLWESRGDIVEGCLRLAKSIKIDESQGAIAAVSAYPSYPSVKGKGKEKGKGKGFRGKGRTWKGKGIPCEPKADAR